MPEKESKYGAGLDGTLKSIYIDGEYNVVKNNAKDGISDFESMIDLIECKRVEGDYSWHSDTFYPAYTAIFLTQSALDASQLAQTRDYSEVYLQDGSPDAKKKSEAAKELINRTLNQRHLHYFQKIMRAQEIRRINKSGVVLRCWWEREDEPVVTGFKSKPVEDTVDVYGMEIVDKSVQVPRMKNMMEPIIENEPLIDRFNFDIVDPRNVWMSDEYTYSIQDKRFVYIRYEKTLDELESESGMYGYINIDKLSKVDPPKETDTSLESYNKEEGKQKDIGVGQGQAFDIIERYGKGYVVVTERDPLTGMPLNVKPGYDEFGKKKENSELQEICIAWAKSGGNYILIRHQLTAYVDTRGNPYRPLVRGICYLHPTKDGGIGDGAVANQMQVAINDTLNMSNDRVRLATMPVIKVNAYDAEESESVYEFKPGHRMELSDIKNAEEFKISSDISGAMNQVGLFINNLHQGIGVYPPQMGDSPGGDVTATATASAGTHASIRSAYQALTAEHTMLTELYSMILQMTGKFAHPKTGDKLMGYKVSAFDPNADYFYKPVTSSIEPESSKIQKRKDLTTVFGYVAQVPNPGTPKLLNKLLVKFFESFGDEYEDFKNDLLDPSAPMQPPTQGGIAGGATSNPMSNQEGTPMPIEEQNVRGAAGGY